MECGKLVPCPMCEGKGGFMAPTPECPADVWNNCGACNGQAEITVEEATEIQQLIDDIEA